MPFNFLLQTADPMAGAGGLGMFLPLILIVLIMYVFMIRPQNKKQKMLDALQKGDKVVTIGGIHGTISSVKKESGTVIVKVDDNAKIEFNRSAIASVVTEKKAEPKSEEKKSLFGRKKEESKEPKESKEENPVTEKSAEEKDE
jgi:preprotein translocase subunit YajC